MIGPRPRHNNRAIVVAEGRTLGADVQLHADIVDEAHEGIHLCRRRGRRRRRLLQADRRQLPRQRRRLVSRQLHLPGDEQTRR